MSAVCLIRMCACAQIDVSGEISGFKCYNKSGHLYFSVKDESSAVPCVMFRSSTERLRFAPKDGMSVVLHGSPSLYTRDGKFQFYVTSMHEAGEGELFSAIFLELKSKLEAEGHFFEKAYFAVYAEMHWNHNK